MDTNVYTTVGPYPVKTATRLVIALQKQGATQIRMAKGDYGSYVTARIPRR